MIKYSFLIPAYNVENYLGKCLDSLVNQKFSPEEYEIVVVNDGSTDKTSHICDYYANSHSNIHVINQANKGLLQARRTGVENSKGEYLVFLDSDDYVSTNLLDVIDKYISDDKPDCLVYSYFRVENGVETPVYCTKDSIEKMTSNDMLKLFAKTDEYNGVAGSKVVKSSILKSHLNEIYDCSINIAEDKIQTFYIIKYSTEFVFVRECLSYYVIRPDSIVQNKKISDIYEVIDVYNIIRKKMLGITTYTNVTMLDSVEEVMNDYDINALNTVLDHIFKYSNSSNETFQIYKRKLNMLIDDNELFFNRPQSIIKNLRIYNIFRYHLIIMRSFSVLYVVDKLLFRLKSIISAYAN